MIGWADARPDTAVRPAEYRRLLGYPPGAELGERALELEQWARDWYEAHGHPWVHARETSTLERAAATIRLDGVEFTGARLSQMLRSAEADAAVLVAVSAGPELEAHAQQLWREGKPDEYFFLEVYGSAVVEHLITMAGARLCAWAEERQRAVLPHDSPGYPDWPIGEQPSLLRLIESGLGGRLEVLDSGMLRPKKSLLAVFGLTGRTDVVRRLTDLVPCEHCAFLGCQYRRVPYQRALMGADRELAMLSGARGPAPAQPPRPLDVGATYTINLKALRRWSEERLVVEHQPDGSVQALFRYEGTTCTNMGRPLAFHYQVTLGPAALGYPIRAQRCAPAPGDLGHTAMCRYQSDPDTLMPAIEDERPLEGRPLNDVLTWPRAVCSAGCYCSPEARRHKWGLVLETLHYALARQAPTAGRL